MPPSRIISAARLISLGCGFSGWMEKNCDMPVCAQMRSEPRPHRITTRRQCRYVADIAITLTGTVKVRSSRSQKPISSRMACPSHKLRWRMRACNHFDSRAAQLYKFPEKAITFSIPQVVTAGVCENSCSAAIHDPLQRIGKCCPLMRHISRLAWRQKVPENRIGITCMSGLYKISRKMRTADKFRILGKLPRTG